MALAFKGEKHRS